MRLIVLLVTVFLSSQCSAMATEPVGPDLRDYSMGYIVGECLAVKCQVFRGYPLADSPKSGDAVSIRVVDWLFGPRSASGTVAVLFEDQSRNGALNDPARAWANVAISTHRPVTVVFGLDHGLGGNPNEPVLVTSGDREAEIVGFLAAEATRLLNTPDLIPDAVASLSRSPNPALAGFLVPYLRSLKSIKQPGLPSQMLLQMAGNPGVPAEGWEDICFWARMTSGGLGPEGPEILVRRFIELAQQQDSRAALTGLNELAAFAQNGHFLDHPMPPAAMGKLADTYRRLVAARKMNRNEPLEAVLGIK